MNELVLVDLKKLSEDLRNMGWGNKEVDAIWHTLWDYSGDWLSAYDERFEKYRDGKRETIDGQVEKLEK